MSIATERRAQVSVQVGNQEISFETGKLAKQADGAVVVRSGETMVLATAVGRPEAREGADFFPPRLPQTCHQPLGVHVNATPTGIPHFHRPLPYQAEFLHTFPTQLSGNM